MWKCVGLFLRSNHLWRYWAVLFSKLDWSSYIVSIAKTVSKNIGALIRSMKFLSPEVPPYFYKSTMQPCIDYCHAWTGDLSCYLDMIHKLQKRICRTVGPTLAASLEPLGYRRNVVRLCYYYRYYFGRCSIDLAELVRLPCSRGRFTRYSDRSHDFLSPFLDIIRMSMSTVSFLAQPGSGIFCRQNAFLLPMI